MNFDVEANTILLTVTGSRAYGTNLPTSDYDYKGVAVPPIEYFVGFANKFEQQQQLVSNGFEHDKTVYDIRKFFSLATACNPNIIEMLWLDDYKKLTVVGRKLVENRTIFLSKRAKHTFSGYAHAQLKRINSHRKWLLDPPKHEPCRAEFGLPESRINGDPNSSTYNFIGESAGIAFDLLAKEKRYADALNQWKQYKNWLATRNPERAALEAKCGFDGKHASHLIRLLRMAVEILDGKGVIVKRPDAADLIEIRQGNWTYAMLMDEADALEKRCEQLYQTSTLQHTPSVARLDALCKDIVLSHIGFYGV